MVDVLRVAAGDGRLTVDELDECLEAAQSARTLSELAVLTADLVAGPTVATAEPEDVIRTGQRGGSVRRTGHWVVPRQLEMRTSWCDVTLDVTEAVIMHDTLRIAMNMHGGSLTLVTGPGIVMDADSLPVRYTEVNISPGAGPGEPVILRVQLFGRTRYGRIEERWLPRTPGQ